MRLERKYEAEAAHRLTAGVPEGHPCRRLHGHRYIITVTIIGDVNPETGMLLEYAAIDERVRKVLDLVDHRDLNDLAGHSGAQICCPSEACLVTQNPTVENLAAWFKAELSTFFPRTNFKVGPLSLQEPQVYAVRIEEDSRSAVEV